MYNFPKLGTVRPDVKKECFKEKASTGPPEKKGKTRS